MSKFLMMGMSLRKDSFNKKLIFNAHNLLSIEKSDHEFELLHFNDYPMPLYDAEIEAKGMPDTVVKLAQKISEADAIILSTPEYNGGMPGPFKNLFDWISRVKPMPWTGKHVLLLGASPGALGAIRGLAHTRVPLQSEGMFVYPDMFGLPKAHEAFDANDLLKDPKTTQKLGELLLKFRDHLKR